MRKQSPFATCQKSGNLESRTWPPCRISDSTFSIWRYIQDRFYPHFSIGFLRQEGSWIRFMISLERISIHFPPCLFSLQVPRASSDLSLSCLWGCHLTPSLFFCTWISSIPSRSAGWEVTGCSAVKASPAWEILSSWNPKLHPLEIKWRGGHWKWPRQENIDKQGNRNFLGWW